MKLKQQKKLLAQVLPHSYKREVNLVKLSATYWSQTQRFTDLTYVYKG